MRRGFSIGETDLDKRLAPLNHRPLRIVLKQKKLAASASMFTRPIRLTLHPNMKMKF